MALSSRIAACTPEFATDREASEIDAVGEGLGAAVLLYARARVWRAGKRYYTYRVRYLKVPSQGRKTYPSPAKFARDLL